MAERVFALPDLGEGLEDGTVVAWLVAEGDRVQLNQPLVEVETAKATVEIPSPFAGTVVRLHGAEGAELPVGAPLVTIEVAGADRPAEPVETADDHRTVRAVEAGRAQSGRAQSGRALATPPVRKLAKELGLDLGTIAGSGPGGRVTEADVREAGVGADGGDGASLDDLGYKLVEVGHVRAEIAANLEQTAVIPQVTTFRTVDCGALEALRGERGVSPLPVVIAALARVYPGHPLINASWSDTGIRVHRHLHVGLAVDAPRGLVVPRLHNADSRGITELAEEIARLATAARDDHLALEDVAGVATMGVSNTGSYGSEAGTPLLTPGCAITLAVGVITPRALVVDGEVVARPAATLSLTFDHRVLDGAAAGRALTELVAILQSEERLRDLPR